MTEMELRVCEWGGAGDKRAPKRTFQDTMASWKWCWEWREDSGVVERKLLKKGTSVLPQPVTDMWGGRSVSRGREDRDSFHHWAIKFHTSGKRWGEGGRLLLLDHTAFELRLRVLRTLGKPPRGVLPKVLITVICHECKKYTHHNKAKNLKV